MRPGKGAGHHADIGMALRHRVRKACSGQLAKLSGEVETAMQLRVSKQVSKQARRQEMGEGSRPRRETTRSRHQAPLETCEVRAVPVDFRKWSDGERRDRRRSSRERRSSRKAVSPIDTSTGCRTRTGNVKHSVKVFARKHAHERHRERRGVAGALLIEGVYHHCSTRRCPRYIDEIAFCFEQRERSHRHPRLPGRFGAKALPGKG